MRSSRQIPNRAVYRSGWYLVTATAVALVSCGALLLHRFGALVVHGPVAWAVDGALIVFTLATAFVVVSGAASQGQCLVVVSAGFLHLRAGMLLRRRATIPVASVKSVYADWGSAIQTDPPKNLILDLDLKGIDIAKQSGVLVNSGGRWIFSLAVADRSPDEVVDYVRAYLPKAHPDI